MPRNKSEKNILPVIPLTGDWRTDCYITVWYVAYRVFNITSTADTLKLHALVEHLNDRITDRSHFDLVDTRGEGFLSGAVLKEHCSEWLEAHGLTDDAPKRMVLAWNERFKRQLPYFDAAQQK